jgi:hypothetical protein
LHSTPARSFGRTRRSSFLQEGRFLFDRCLCVLGWFDRAGPLGLTASGTWSRNHAMSALSLGPFVSSLATRARNRASVRETRQAKREIRARCPAAAYS